jgi:dTMP kinase
MTGVFISFEGGDGTGKSTQIKILSERLRTAGREVFETREPGGSDGGEAIRALIVKGAKDRWSPLTEALLMYAARSDHLERTILPALERGAVVISDRFADSSMAYQGVAGGAGVEELTALHALVVGARDPDLTIILDAPAEDGLRRADASKGETRFEDKGAEFQRKVRQAYLDIAKAAPERCVVVDARGSVETVAGHITEAVKQRLPAVLS